MNENHFKSSLLYCTQILHSKNVIAYPTESMFGLGCDPTSRKAVTKLLSLKKRSIKKGFILVASDFNQIKMYIDESRLSKEQIKKLFFYWPGPFTFLLPANSKAPSWITGQFNTVAVRISAHFEIIKLCNFFGKALISTSANITSQPPCMTPEEISESFGSDFPLLYGKIGNEKNPSRIINIVNGNLIRYV